MTRKTAAIAALITVQALIPGARSARAEEVDADRLQRLERVLALQAAELERLHVRLEELEAPRPAPTGSPPPPAPTRPPVAGPERSDPAPVDMLEFDRTANRLQRKMEEAHIDPFAQVGPSVRLGGYLTLEYIAPSDRSSWFDLHRFVLQADAVITEGVDMVTEIEYEHGGIGGGAEGDVEIEYLEVAFRPHDAFQLKVGAILIPFGRYNLYHDDPFNDFTQRPWIARYFVPTGFGQPGVGVEGALPVGCDGVLTYDVAVTGGFGEGFSSSSGVRPTRQRWQTDNNENKQVWGRLAYDPGRSFLDRLEVGVSGTYGTWDERDDRSIFGWGLDLLARKGPFELQGEYVHYDIGQDPTAPASEPRAMSGLWLQGGFHFFPSFLCGCGAPFVTDTSHFTLAIRYQSMDLNDRIRGASFNDDARSWGVALNYRITEQTVFRIDQSWITAVNEPDKQEFTASFSTWF